MDNFFSNLAPNPPETSRPDFKRVFYHELGHFVAHKLNEYLYGYPGVLEFKICPFYPQSMNYEGGVTPEAMPRRSTNDNIPAPLERLPQKL